MGFIDSKERVLEISLTQHGRKKLSEGKLSVKYYSFSDDEVDYQTSAAFGSNITFQNEVVMMQLFSSGSFTRGSDGFYQTSANTLSSAAVDVKRFEDKGEGFGALLLIESLHTNALPNNRDLTQGTWQAGGAGSMRTASVIAGPDGQVLANRIFVPSGVVGPFDGIVAGDPNSFSLWGRSFDGNEEPHQMWAGKIGTISTGVNTLTGSWQKFDIQNSNTAPNTLVPVEGRSSPDPSLSDIETDMYLDLVQYVTGRSFPQSPVETGATAASCSADNLTVSASALPERIVSGPWTFSFVPEWSSGDIEDTDEEKFFFTFQDGNHGLSVLYDTTGSYIRMLSGGTEVARSNYLTSSREERMWVTVDPPHGRLKVNGVTHIDGSNPNWSLTGAFRWGGIANAADGSGQEIDARFFDEIYEGEIQPFALSAVPIGDSITVGGAATSNNNYPKLLSIMLNHTGSTTGSLKYQNVGPYRKGTFFDAQHAGVNGEGLDDMTDRILTDIVPFRPNVIILHGGTNNIGSGSASMLSSLENFIDTLYNEYNSETDLFIVTEIPERTGSIAVTTAFNAGIDAVISASSWPLSKIRKASPGVLVTETADGVHPTDIGHQKIAGALESVIITWMVETGRLIL